MIVPLTLLHMVFKKERRFPNRRFIQVGGLEAVAPWFSPGRRKMRVSAAFPFLALATIAPAQWIEKNSRDENSFDGRIVHREVDLAEAGTDNRAIVDLALLSTKSCKLRVIDN